MKKLIYFLIVFCILSFEVKSQTYFTPTDTLQNFIISNRAAICEWIDYDNDNDLDLFLIAKSALYVYDNDGNGNFTLNNNSSYITNTLMSGFRYKDYGDFNNDGYIDFLTSTAINSRTGILNNKLPTSIGFDTTSFPGSFILSWDNIYNFKGNDIILSDNPHYTYKILQLNDSLYYQVKDSIYVSSTPVLQLNLAQESYNNSDGSWTTYNYDINNDGFMDFITYGGIAINNGFDSSYKFSFISRFSNIYPWIDKGDFHFHDLNNDGYLDEIANRVEPGVSNYYANKISRNTGSNSFVEQNNTGIDSFTGSEQFIFDYNNDGKIDILVEGRISYSPFNYGDTNLIFTNQGNFSFNKDTTILNLGNNIYNASAADYDNDGDIDLAICYYDTITDTYKTTIYRNDSTPPNNMPTAPTTMWTTMDSSKIIFHWKPGTDIETPQATLSYNLMVGTSPNGIDIVSPLSDTATGFRRVVELGNAQLNDLFILDKSKFNNGDTIYWRVQTLDNSQGYSPFSPLQKTIVCNKIEEPVFDTICSNDSAFWKGNYYSSVGRFKETYGTSSCDSTFFLDLKVNQSYFNQQSADICANETYYWNGQSYNQPGTYTLNYTTTKGCDSVEKLVLHLHHSVTNILDEQICVQDSFPFGGAYLNSSGFYTDSSQTNFGCDSLTLLTLTVSPSDTTVFKSNDTLFTTNYSAYKRWYNCETQSYVTNQNNSYFVPNQPGKYAAELTENGCTWMSGCFDFTYLGIENFENIDISVEPNPAFNSITIISDAISKNSVIKIYSTDSKLVYNQESDSENKILLDIENLASGVYFIKIINSGGLYSVKFVKE